MTTWYDPQETKNEADGAQRQPEFDPPEETLTTETTGPVANPHYEALEDRVNEIKEIVDALPQ